MEKSVRLKKHDRREFIKRIAIIKNSVYFSLWQDQVLALVTPDAYQYNIKNVI